jgi:threonine aldolase
MRQAGVLAAAGIIALESMIERLEDDHARARRLADGLKKVSGLVLDTGTPATNMVYFNLAGTVRMDADQVTERLKQHGILVAPEDSMRFRLVTHYWINDEGVERTIQAFGDVLSDRE